MIYLKGTGGEYNGKEVPLENEVILGRDSFLCQVVFSADASEVSGVHCKLQIVEGGIQLTDMGSTNGTFLDSGVRLQPNQTLTLSVGQGFYLSDRMNSFVIYDTSENSEETPEQKESVKTMEKSLGGAISFSIAAFVCGILAVVLGIAYLVSHISALIPALAGVLGLIFGILSLVLHAKGKAMAIIGSAGSAITVIVMLVFIIKIIITPPTLTDPPTLIGCWTISDWSRVEKGITDMIIDQVEDSVPGGWAIGELMGVLYELMAPEAKQAFIAFQEDGGLYIEPDSSGTSVQTLMEMSWEDLGSQQLLLNCKVNLDTLSFTVAGFGATLPPVTIAYRTQYKLTDETLELDLFGEKVTLWRMKTDAEEVAEENIVK